MFLGREGAGGDEAEYHSTDGDAEPEAGRGHTGGEAGAVAYAEHEFDGPAADGDFDAHVD